VIQQLCGASKLAGQNNETGLTDLKLLEANGFQCHIFPHKFVFPSQQVSESGMR
jgi:hypothetical protein